MSFRNFQLGIFGALLLKSQSLPNLQDDLLPDGSGFISTTTALTTQPWDIAIDCIPNYLLNTSTTTESTTTDVTCGFGYDCVPFYLCKDKKIIGDGSGLFDRRRKRSIRKNAVSKKCTNVESCCKIEIQELPTLVQKECGIRNVDGLGFQISGGGARNNDTDYAEFPWMIVILGKEKFAEQIINVYKCGGSLITSSVVLTAAHCVAKIPANSLIVRAGEWDTENNQELYMHQDRDLIDIVVHENFKENSLINDIALLFLSIPFDFDENIQPVCLPPHGTNFDHLRCFATGWGKDIFGKTGKYQIILKKIDLPTIPNPQCEAELRNTRLGRYFRLNKSFICAGGEIGKGTCTGDEGSPLVCPIPNTDNRYYQAGIAAGRIGCGNKVPDIFASISYLRPWIDEVLAKKNIPHTQFTYR